MSRNTEYQFLPTDTAALESLMIAAYEKLMGVSVQPASPDMLFIKWVASIVVQERARCNYVGNQNIPSRAEGDNLDALGELFYASERPDAQPSVCTIRFRVSEAQDTAILIPSGTRVTDRSATLYWETEQDVYIPIGGTSVDVAAKCQTAGRAGNGYAVGQINTIVDVFDYYTECENITVSDGGADRLSDDEYYELLRSSMDAYSTAGAIGNYIYHAKSVSPEIRDVVANSPSPGEVRLYVLMKDGTMAGDEMKAAVLKECNGDTVRPMTDHVQMGEASFAEYDIDFTYWIGSSTTTGSDEIARRVDAAVQEYIAWQGAKLGRDINPSTLIGLLMQTGIKRVELRSPTFTQLRDGQLTIGREYAYEDTVPQLAASRTVTVVNGGREDE